MKNYEIHAFFLGQNFSEEQKEKIFSVFTENWSPAVYLLENKDCAFVAKGSAKGYPTKIVDKIAKEIMQIIGGEDPQLWMNVVRLDEHPRDRYFYRRGQLLTTNKNV